MIFNTRTLPVVLFIAVSLFFTGNLSAQPTFQKSIGTAANESGKLYRLSNGFALIGESDATGNNDILVARLDANLNLLWSRSIGNNFDDISDDLIELDNGNLLFSGMLRSSGILQEAIVAELDNNTGNILWANEFIGNYDRQHFLLKTFSGNILSAGSLEGSTGSSRNKPSFVLYDSALNISWRYFYQYSQGLQPDPFNNEIYGRAICQVPADSGFIYLMEFNYSGTPQFQPRLLKLNSNGSLLWIKGYELGGDDRVSSVACTDDGGFILCGHTDAYSSNNDIFVIKTDAGGAVLWSKTYSGANTDEAISIKQTPDGGYALAGHTRSFGFGGYDALLLKLNLNGNLQWAKAYGGAGDEQLRNMQLLPTGFLLSGSTNSFGLGGSDIYLVKTDSQGMVTDTCFRDVTGLVNVMSRTPVVYNRMYQQDTLINPTTVFLFSNVVALADTSFCSACPDAFFSASQNCSGDTVFFQKNYTAFDSIIYWNYGNGISDTVHRPWMVYSTSGTFTITLVLMNQLSGCTDTFSQTISTHNLSGNLFGPDTVLCQGDVLVLSAAMPGGVYLWQDGSTNPTFTVAGAGVYHVQVTDSSGCFFSDTLGVRIGSRPAVSAIGDTVLCAGQCANLSVTGGSGYIWQPAAGLNNANIASPTACPQASTTYYVTGYGGAIELIVNGDFEQGAVGFNSDYTFGSGGSAMYVVDTDPFVYNTGHTGSDHTTGSGNFLIVDGATNNTLNVWCQTVTVLPNTTYTFMAWVNNIANPSANLADPTIEFTINGSTLCLAIPVPEVPDLWIPITCTWNSGNNALATLCVRSRASDFVGNDFGIDDISFTGPASCPATDSVLVAVSALPTLNLGNDSSLCLGDTLLLDAGSGWVSYLWQNGDTTQTLIATTQGTYWAAVTNASGCTKADTIEIALNNASMVNLGNDTSICAGDGIVFDAGNIGATYLWHNGSTNQTYSTNMAELIYVTVSNNTCSAADTVLLRVDPLPVASLGNDRPLCPDSTIALVASPTGATYLWHNGTTLPTLAVASPGTYWVLVTDTNGCSDSSSVNISAGASVQLGSDTLICPGVAARLQAGLPNAVSFSWSNGANGPAIIVTAAGNYSVTATDLSGCRTADSIKVDIQTVAPVLSVTDTTVCKQPISLSLSGNISAINWNDGTGDTLKTVTEVGIYWVSATDENGCTTTDTVTVTEDCPDIAPAIPTAFTPNGDGINDFFWVIAADAEILEIMVFNRWGERIFRTNDYRGKWDGTYLGYECEAGVYTWIVKYKDPQGAQQLLSGNVTLIK